MCGLLALASVHAFAWEVPGYQVDSRVRQVVYNPANVVRVYAQRGIGTQIALNASEKIVAVALGDNAKVEGCGAALGAQAGAATVVPDWKISACKGDSNIFVKPGSGAHDTNLIVHTDRRNYAFDLMVLPHAAKFGNAQVMYRVTFTYPQDIEAEHAVHARASLIAQREAEPAAKRNEAYSMQAVPGSDDIVPSAMWDDGRFTYITVPGNRKIAAAFRLADDGTEHVPDKHMDGDTIVLHEVANRWVLRLGNEAVELWNDAYDLDGVPPVDGTTVPGVARVVKGSENDWGRGHE
ncbi:type IV secretion system protein VirB9 [Burkholderia ubonensis]|uniref:TrbG/VirB9 family P-type conjugative transfer protein n=1 Tax=Burkholderia ubonensis TaxID=101571 RepID=UPI00075ED5EF|nr:TrbG/VirB9 family P-type conjugative transfer protein [Burkholderia ubonensis]KVU84460.1 type IV secretion system protein VirB9 [Burkholderia ubonensis]